MRKLCGIVQSCATSSKRKAGDLHNGNVIEWNCRNARGGNRLYGKGDKRSTLSTPDRNGMSRPAMKDKMGAASGRTLMCVEQCNVPSRMDHISQWNSAMFYITMNHKYM